MNTPSGMASAAVGKDHRGSDDSGQESKKESSPTSFLPNLKTFDIEAAKFKNYDHQSSVPTDTSPSIDRIMLNPKSSSKPSAKSAPHTTAHSRSSSISSEAGNPLKSPLEPLDGEVLRALQLPSDKPWPYSEDTLNELIRLRIEQEKTKHTSIKQALGQTVLELLREASQHDISEELIRRLFLGSDLEAHSYVHYLQNSMANVLHQSQSVPVKRKNSAESIHTPNTTDIHESSKPVSQIQSQTQSRASPRVPEDRRPSASAATSNPNPVPSPGHPTGSGPGSVTASSQSPRMPVVPQHVYPVYYAYPDQAQGMPQLRNPPNAPKSNASASGHHQKSASQSEESENLGSPYSHKYPTVVFQSSPVQYPNTPASSQSGQPQRGQPQAQPHPHAQPQPQGQPTHQHPQPFYYINSSPQGIPGPLIPSQYFVPPPMGTVFPWTQVAPPVPEREEKSAKRHKSTKNGINFMITTPKNPPAKKYNKS